MYGADVSEEGMCDILSEDHGRELCLSLIMQQQNEAWCFAISLSCSLSQSMQVRNLGYINGRWLSNTLQLMPLHIYMFVKVIWPLTWTILRAQ